MCGIAGIINGTDAAAGRRTLAAAARCLAARGPDGEGMLDAEGVQLLHRRLAVIDPVGGAQPLFNEGRTLALVVNGEIYNYLELRAELLKAGHVFSSASDSEVILHGFEEYGEDIFSRLDGMFALALYDLSKRRLHLARDPFGQKPLFYFRCGARALMFASTLEALKCHPSFPHRQYRQEAVGAFLSYWYVPGPETIYPGVFQLEPGTRLCFDADSGAELPPYRYFSLDFRSKNRDDEATQLLRTRQLLDRAVRKRLMADVPLGAFLSGGLDSMIVTGLMLKAGVENLEIYSMGFEDRAYDELSAVHRSLAELRDAGLDSWTARERVVRPDDIELLYELWRAVGQPFGDASILPTGLLCRFARTSLVVALSGDGADELFGGYERYLAMRFYRKLDWLPDGVRRPVAGALATLLPSYGERSFTGKCKRLLELGRCRSLERYYHLMNKAEAQEKLRIAGERLRPVIGSGAHDPAMEYLLGHLGRTGSADACERCAEADLFTYMANDILPKVDTASMSTALEVRSPFLDRDLAQWAASLPWERKLAGTSRKDILKRACSDWLPREVSRRPKKGFGVPVAHYLASSWRPALEAALTGGVLLSDGWITRSGGESLLARRDPAAVNLQWGLFCLAGFFEQDGR